MWFWVRHVLFHLFQLCAILAVIFIIRAMVVSIATPTPAPKTPAHHVSRHTRQSSITVTKNATPVSVVKAKHADDSNTTKPVLLQLTDVFSIFALLYAVFYFVRNTQEELDEKRQQASKLLKEQEALRLITENQKQREAADLKKKQDRLKARQDEMQAAKEHQNLIGEFKAGKHRDPKYFTHPDFIAHDPRFAKSRMDAFAKNLKDYQSDTPVCSVCNRTAEYVEMVVSHTAATYSELADSIRFTVYCVDCAVSDNSAEYFMSPEFVKSDPRWKRLSTAFRMLQLKRHGVLKCRLCGCVCDQNSETRKSNIDHIQPRKTHPGQALDPSNLQVLCATCNKGKANREDLYADR